MKWIGEFTDGSILVVMEKDEFQAQEQLLKPVDKNAWDYLSNLYNQIPIQHTYRRTINAVKRHHRQWLKRVDKEYLFFIARESRGQLESRNLSREKLNDFCEFMLDREG
jgi:hypothetical protein